MGSKLGLMEQDSQHTTDPGYYPLVDTLRLYAGWLLTLLLLVEAVGAYAKIRSLPFAFPLLEEWVDSPAIFMATVATFLFLMLSGLHRMLGGGFWSGLIFGIAGMAVLTVVQANL